MLNQRVLLYAHSDYHISKHTLGLEDGTIEVNLKQNPNPNIKDDLELVQWAFLGDNKAIARLVLRYKNPLYFTILRMVKQPEDAEDITMEAINRAVEKLDTYSPEHHFSSWLFRKGINQAILHNQKKKNLSISYNAETPPQEQETLQEILPTNQPNPEEGMIKEQRAVIIANYINCLKPKYKKMIELRFLEERSYEEIAEQLEMPIGTVKAQLFRAKDHLQNLLSPSKDLF